MTTTIQSITAPSQPIVKTINAEVLTLEEVAEYLRFPIDAIRGHAVQGLLPGNEINGEWRFLKSAIDSWLVMPKKVPLRSQGRVTTKDIEAAQARVPEILALLDRWTTPEQETYQTETWNQLDQNLPRHVQSTQTVT